MKRLFMVLALCATVALPAAAFAQAGPPGMGGGPPSPQQRAAMEKFRADAKASAYAALTPAHATSVGGIAAQVAGGSLDRRAAVGQIDALLSPGEQKAVLAAAAKSRAAMRAASPAGGPPRGGRFGPPSAGRFLLMVSLSPRQMRNTMPRARSTSAP